MIGDKPKDNISEDLFHRKELVDSLVNIIKTCDVSRSVAIGICGKWGSGKTTLINFIRENIEKEKEIVTVDFNPWIYSSQSDLSVQLLNCVSYHLSPKYKMWIKKHLSKYRVMANVATNIIDDARLNKLLKLFSDLIIDNRDGVPLEDLKSSISGALKKTEKRVVVVIDDLDRLKQDEIVMMIKLVRSVTDFSNVIYILSYDDQIVEKALTTDYYSGHEYIQKIIDLQVHIPEVDESVILDHLAGKYLDLIEEEQLNDYETQIFNSFLNCSVSERDVCRVLSKFELLFSVSKNNTCPIDLLALTLIDVKEPSIYNWISNNRLNLCGFYMPPFEPRFEKKEKNSIIDLYRNEINNGAYENLLTALFPSFNPNHRIPCETVMEYRICEYRFIDNYYLLTPSSLKITDECVNKAMRIHDPIAFYDFVSNNEIKLLYELSVRISEKINSDDSYFEYAETLAKMILNQPFSDDRIIDHFRISRMAPVLQLYLEKIKSDNNLAELISLIPHDNVRKTIIFGYLVHRYYPINSDDEYSSLKPLFDIVSDIICSDIDSYDPNAVELLYALVFVSERNNNKAREIFLKKKPSPQEREAVYSELKELMIDSKFLSDLVQDSIPRGIEDTIVE